MTIVKKHETKKQLTSYIFLLLPILLLIGALLLRFWIFNVEGGDHPVYKKAVLDFSSGINPYKYTYFSYCIRSLDKGYAYFPTLLYIMTAMWKFNVITNADIPTAILWKIPVLLADLGVAYLIYDYFTARKEKFLAIVAAGIWLFNPYFLVIYEYSLLDPIQVFFLFLALKYLEKSTLKTAFFYALAVSTKIIPVILFPLFLVKTKRKVKFLFIFLLVLMILSLPFLTSLQDIFYYINGAVLVHQDRTIQGRPILSFLTFFVQNLGVTFYQEFYPSIYSKISLFIGPILSLYLLVKKKVSNKYILTAITFACYFLLTPVFNRTHFLWGFPFFIITFYEITKGKKRVITYGLLVGLYLILTFYLLLWDKGLKAPDENHQKIWISGENGITYSWPFKDFMKNKYYEYRGILLNKD